MMVTIFSMFMKYIYLLFFIPVFFTGCSTIDKTSNEKESSHSFVLEEKQWNDDKKEDKEILGYEIWNVIDGDTLEVIIHEKTEKIRILGINTPEKEGGFRTAECFGDHASDYAKEYLDNKKVLLLESKTGDKKDRYGRLLRYVFVEGEDFGAHLIKEGYAESYKKFPHDRQSYYNTLESESQKQNKGMWNPENCEFWGQEN